jgi:hypothetical protein
MDNHFNFDSAHGSASDLNHWNVGGSGTYHGDSSNIDYHVGGNIADHGGHYSGDVSGGITIHATPNIDFGAGGHMSSNHVSGGQISVTGHW